LNADPYPATQINADPWGSGYGSGSETLHKMNGKITISQANFRLKAFSLDPVQVGQKLTEVSPRGIHAIFNFFSLRKKLNIALLWLLFFKTKKFKFKIIVL
jgi:hypothetical protein